MKFVRVYYARPVTEEVECPASYRELMEKYAAVCKERDELRAQIRQARDYLAHIAEDRR